MALYVESLNQIRKNIREYKLKPSALDSQSEENQLLKFKSQLEQLRKGCCHPQILDKSLRPSMYHNKQNHGSKNSGSNSGTSHLFSGPRPLEEIMVLKVEQARALCEQTQRELLLHVYSMAGVGLLAATHTTHASALVRALELYFFAWKSYQKNRSVCPLLGILRFSGNENISLGFDKLEDYENGDFIISPHLTDGILISWELEKDTQRMTDEGRVASLEWKEIQREKDIKFPTEQTEGIKHK